MPFDPDHVSALFSQEAEFHEDFRERLRTASVFERAADLQRQFLDKELSADDLLSAWNSSQDFFNSLDTQASKEGLMGEVVTISGSGLEIPKFQTDLPSASFMVNVEEFSELTEKTLEKYYDADAAKGNFSGFSLRFIKQDNDMYIPKLVYQALFATVDTPHAHINLYATGIVGEVELSFEQDEKMDNSAPLFEKVFAVCGHQPESINRINVVLNSVKKLDGSSMRHISYHAEKILNSAHPDKLAEVEDVLVEFLAHYIDPSGLFSAKTSAYSISAENAQKGAEYYQDEDLFAINGQSRGLVFLQDSSIAGGEVTFRKRKVLSLIMAHEARNVFIPIKSIDEFSIV